MSSYSAPPESLPDGRNVHLNLDRSYTYTEKVLQNFKKEYDKQIRDFIRGENEKTPLYQKFHMHHFSHSSSYILLYALCLLFCIRYSWADTEGM